MNAVEYIYKMFFRKKKCIVMCTLELQQTVFTLSFIVAHLLSFPSSPWERPPFSWCLFKKFSKKNLGEQSLIGKLEVIGYVLLGFPGFQEIGISLLAIAKEVSKRPWLGGYCTLDWKNTQKYLKFFWKQLAIPNHIGNRGEKYLKILSFSLRISFVKKSLWTFIILANFKIAFLKKVKLVDRVDNQKRFTFQIVI